MTSTSRAHGDPSSNGRVHSGWTPDEIEDLVVREASVSRRLAQRQRSFVDLGAMMRNGVPPVEYLPGDCAHGMVYRSGVTVFSGHPESAKSILALLLSKQYMEHGGHVVYNDYENGDEEELRRLRDFGVSASMISEQFHYLPFPDAPDWEVIELDCDRWPGVLSVWDSLRGVMHAMGLNENDAGDCSRFFQPLAKQALVNKVPHLVIDHVTKVATEKTLYGRGSGDKLAAVQASWFVKKVKPLSENEVGRIKLTRWKARSGGLPPDHHFTVGDGKGGLVIERIGIGQVISASPTTRMRNDIVEFLKKHHPKTWSKQDLESAISGGASDVRAAAAQMAVDEMYPIKLDFVVENGKRTRFQRFSYVPEEDMAGIDFRVEREREDG